ncbi:MAG: exosortase-associated EpsI family protein [Verrucomicrobiales bacterium]|nr:exosortase-associated EpsI family protein [Verrucomicrobiales bacterium]
MTRRTLPLTAVVLVAIVAMFSFLVRVRDHQQMGIPAVRLIGVPLIGTDGRLARTNSIFLPTRVSGFETKTGVVADQELGFLPPDTSFGRQIYRSLLDDFTVQASVVLMGRDRTSIHQPDFCLTGAGWTIQRKQYTTIRLAGSEGRELPVRRFDAFLNYTAADGTPRKTAGVYVFWFAADGVVTASQVRRTASMLEHLVRTGVLQRWSYTSFFAQCEPGNEDATFSRLSDLIAKTVPEFQRFELAAAQ